MTDPNKIRDEMHREMRHNYNIGYVILFFVVIAEATLAALVEVSPHNKKLLNLGALILCVLTVILTSMYILPYFNEKVYKRYNDILNPKDRILD